MKEYCLKWDLTANPTKTKVVIFGRGIIRNLPVFMYEDEPIEIVVKSFTLVLNLVLTVVTKTASICL